MEVSEPACHVMTPTKNLVEAWPIARLRSLINDILKRTSPKKFHLQQHLILANLVRIVDLSQVGMVELRQQLGFPQGRKHIVWLELVKF